MHATNNTLMHTKAASNGQNSILIEKNRVIYRRKKGGTNVNLHLNTFHLVNTVTVFISFTTLYYT